MTVCVGEVTFVPVPTIRSLVSSLVGGVPPGVLIVGSVLNALGSFVLEVDEEVVTPRARRRDGAVVMPAAVVPLPELDPQPAIAAPTRRDQAEMVNVLRMNARGG